MGNKNSKIGDYEVDHKTKLGEGSFGAVYVGYVKATREKLAVKTSNMKSKDQMEVVTEEIKTMEHIPRHENIVEFFDVHFHKDAAWVFMEFCELGHLGQIMSKHGRELDDKVDIMFQCTRGLHYLHSLEHPIAHRDLKPENILFRKIDGKVVAKLADFGLSKILYLDTLLKTIAGSVLYMAPEITTAETYTMSVDIFSLGLLFLSMVLYDSVGQLLPLSVASEMIQARHRMRALPIVIVPSVHDEHRLRVVKRLINKMVVYDPDERLALSMVEVELRELLGMATSGQTSDQDSQLQFSLSGTDGGRALLTMLMKRAMQIPESHESPDSEVMDTLSTLSLGLQINETLDTLTDTANRKFKLGERVVVESKREKVMAVQKHDWVEQMAQYLGKDGWVYENQGHDVYTVKFDDGYRFAFCGSVLKYHKGKPIPLKSDKIPFKVGAMVTVSGDSKTLPLKQKQVKQWDTKMHLCRGTGGMVHKVTPDGLCTVEAFNGDIWNFHPDVLSHRNVENIKLQVDDFVLISPSRDVVKGQMKQCGLAWETEMEKCLDSNGRILELSSSKTALVKSEGLKVDLPTSVLTHYATKRDIDKAKMTKRLIEKGIETIKEKKTNRN